MKKKKVLFIVLFVFLVIVLLGVINLFVNPFFTLKNKKTIYLEVNDNYKEYGYNFIGLKKSDVIINNNIDNKKLGTYEVTYKYKNKTKKRNVVVVDTTSPEITLKGNNPSYVCSYDTYVEEGYEVSDNYDAVSDLKVITYTNNDTKIYEVLDTSGNKKVVERKLIKKDTENPIITLTGGSDVTIYKGNSFDDKYSAFDNCDEDLTKEVKVMGSVDTKNVGVYNLTYEVTDTSGNKTTAKRKVTVKEKKLYTDSVIYLTFDDGPSSDVTPYILDILKKYNIKATFFVIGTTNNDSLIKREFDEGHTIGLHSYTHKYSIYKSADTYFNDLQKISDKVYNITGQRSMIIRFPGGSSNTVSKNYKEGIMSYLTTEVEKLGYTYFDWNVGSSDTSTNSAKKTCDNVKKRLGRGTNVVLMHDYSSKTSNIEALECIIKYGLDNGYSFDRITYDTKVIHHNVAN